MFVDAVGMRLCVLSPLPSPPLQVALKGVSFCAGGKMVFKLILDNTFVLVAVNTIGEVVMFLGKVIAACVSAFVAFWILDKSSRFQEGGKDEVSSTWLPVLVRAPSCCCCCCCCCCMCCCCLLVVLLLVLLSVYIGHPRISSPPPLTLALLHSPRPAPRAGFLTLVLCCESVTKLFFVARARFLVVGRR